MKAFSPLKGIARAPLGRIGTIQLTVTKDGISLK